MPRSVLSVFPLLGPEGFGATILGLVDDKEKGPWIHSFGGKPKTVVDKKVFVSKADLEDEDSMALGGPATAQALIDGGLCRKEGILQSAGVEALGKMTAEAVAQFCRDKGKVDAATCVADVLTAEAAEKIASVSRLLHVLEELSKQ